MRGVRPQLGVRLLLSAAIAFAAIMPPAVRHAHACGDRPHDHELFALDDHDHADDHDHDHDGDAAECDHFGHEGLSQEYALETEDGATSHYHFGWFGWCLTAPTSSGISVAISSGVAGLHAVDWLSLDARKSADRLTALEADSHNLLAARQRMVHCGLMPAASVLLCDTARHERSGVQLS